jgi:hypothetical protein
LEELKSPVNQTNGRAAACSQLSSCGFFMMTLDFVFTEMISWSVPPVSVKVIPKTYRVHQQRYWIYDQ